MIKIENFTKTYRDTVAVQDLSFTVEAGQVLGLLGPNGAGKTTTLRALSGIIPPTGGTLSIAGYDIEKQPIEAKSRLAYVPDDPRLFDTLTVWEHIEFMAAAYRVDSWQLKGTQLLELLHLTDKQDTLAQELSRGMRQKVAIACAYLHDPMAILFDEPHTGLDPRGIRTMKDSLLERAAAGAAIIVSSHLLELVEDVCTHILILDHGLRRFLGTKEELRKVVAQHNTDARLEDAFFHITEGGAPTP